VSRRRDCGARRCRRRLGRKAQTSIAAFSHLAVHSKIVAEKIAHHAISAEQIVANEKQFL